MRHFIQNLRWKAIVCTFEPLYQRAKDNWMSGDLQVPKKFMKAAVGAAALLLVAGGQTFAADLDPVPADPAIHGDLTVYGWLPTVTGKFGVNGLGPYDIPEESDSNILDFLDGFFMANASVRYGDWGLFGDLVYADLGNGETSARGFISAESDLSSLVGTAALTYTLIDAPEGNFDLLAGARFWSVEGGIKLSLTGTGGTWDFEESDTVSWVDPLIGARGRYNISEDFFLTGAGAIGGFGLGSDFMWDAAATIGYNINDNFSASIGYRALGTDYSNDGDVVDIVAHGPVIGLTGRF